MSATVNRARLSRQSFLAVERGGPVLNQARSGFVRVGGREFVHEDLAAVFGGIGAVGCDQRMGEPEPGWCAAEIAMAKQRHVHPVGQYIEHGNRQMSTLAGAAALDEGAQDG